MFTKVMEDQINLDGKTPDFDLNSFSPRQFLQDYENTMSTEHSKRGDGTIRKPYEGDELKATNALLGKLREYSKPPITCLKDQIKAGADLDKFREKTTTNSKMSTEEKNGRKHAVGAMYRAISYYMIQNNITLDEEEKIVVALAASIMAGDGIPNPNLHIKRITRIL